VQFVTHVRVQEYKGQYSLKSNTCFDKGGMTYRTMESPIGKTIIIGRCRKVHPYESRLPSGTLPDEPGTDHEG